MNRPKASSWFLGVFLFLVLLVLLAILVMPFSFLKTGLDRLSRDNSLSMLKPENASVFRFWLGLAWIAIAGILYLSFWRKWNGVTAFLRQSGGDTLRFFSIKKPTKTDLLHLALLLLILVFAVIRRLASIEGPMTHDEAYTVVNFSDTFFHALTDYSMPNNHVLHTLLVNLSIGMWGIAPWVVRLPAFIAGVLLVPGVYVLAKRIYDPWTGILAALLVTFAPDLVHYSTNARGYTLVALFTVLIMILGNYVRQNKNRFAWGLIALFSALGMFTVPVMLFPFGILFIWLLFENLLNDTEAYSSKGEFLRYWLAAGFGAGLLTLLFYTPVLVYSGPQALLSNGFVAPVAWRDLLDIWRSRFTETWKAWTAGVPGVVTVVLGIIWLLASLFHRRIARIKFPLQAAAGIWILTLLVVQRYNAWEKVWVFLLPLMLMWAAAGLMGLLQKVHLPAAYPVSLAETLGILLVLGGAWSTIRLAPKLPAILSERGEVENTLLYLQNNMQENDLVVVDWPDDASYWFYSLEHGINSLHFDKRIPFTRAWIAVNPPDDQTIASVMADRGPDYPLLDLEAAQLVQEFGTHQLYLVPVK